MKKRITLIMSDNAMLIVGSSSDIATALTKFACQRADIDHVLLVSRKPVEMSRYESSFHEKLVHFQCDNNAGSIASVIAKLQLMPVNLTEVFICNGVLHGENITPEKRLADFDEQSFASVIKANTVTPILWLQQLMSIFNKKSQAKVVVFSARVGSISDNKLGGWYSYRASKAALNMLIKTAAIEYKRMFKLVKLVAFHPGTTDTQLSKPFQKNVPAGKLFTPEFVAKQLLAILPTIEANGEASFIDWQGQDVQW